MAWRAWVCESCRSPQKFRDNVFECLGCGREICDDCGWAFQFCKPCANGRSDEELRVAANAQLGEVVYTP